MSLTLADNLHIMCSMLLRHHSCHGCPCHSEICFIFLESCFLHCMENSCRLCHANACSLHFLYCFALNFTTLLHGEQNVPSILFRTSLAKASWSHCSHAVCHSKN